MLIPMKPINLYRSDDDREVWEQAEIDAHASKLSLSAYVVAALRAHQKRAGKARPIQKTSDA